MNKFFYFLAVLCLFTLGSCEKDVKNVQSDIDANIRTAVLVDINDTRNGDTRGGGGNDIGNGSIDIVDSSNAGSSPCDIPISQAFRLYAGDGCPGDGGSTTMTCVINPDYHPSSYTLPEGAAPGHFEYIDTRWAISGGYDDVVSSYTLHFDEMESSHTYYDNTNGYHYNFTISADFQHTTTGDIIRYSVTACISSTEGSCPPLTYTTMSNGNNGNVTLIAYQPLTTSEGPP